MKRLLRFFQLSYQDKRLYCVTWALLNAVRLGLWGMNFKALQSQLNHLSKKNQTPSLSSTDLFSKLVRVINVSCRYSPGQAKCLARALTFKVLITWYGYTGDLYIGVAKPNQGGLDAHAWVEYQGRVVIGQLPDLSRYWPLKSVGNYSL